MTEEKKSYEGGFIQAVLDMRGNITGCFQIFGEAVSYLREHGVGCVA